MDNLFISVRIGHDSLNKAIFGVIGFMLFISLQLCIDIPGVDIPDAKDIPEWMDALNI